MSDPLGGDVFDSEGLAEVEVEKLLKQVCNKYLTLLLRSILEAIREIHGIFIFFPFNSRYFFPSIAPSRQND